MIKILGIPSTLRVASNSRGLLRFAQFLAPAMNMEIAIADLSKIPLYNQDLDNAKDFPQEAIKFRQQIQEADAILFAVSEYNYSVTGVLKNAIDWASRSTISPQPFKGKKGGMIGQAFALGSSRAQYHLRQIMVGQELLMMTKPEFFCQQFYPNQMKFNSKGDLVDEQSQKFLEAYLKDFKKFVHS